jgi:nicotinamide-nucleotide adenylyltransferase
VKRGVFVGRFQPFHKGHLAAIERILKQVDELVIIVGSAQYSHTLRDPFTAGERIEMIRNALSEEGINLSRIWIIPVPDIHHHTLWVAQILGYSPHFDNVYSNDPLTKRLFKEAGFTVESIPFIQRKVYSATEIRKRLSRQENWTELVPNSVASFIKDIHGITRLQDLNRVDTV